MPNIIAVPMLNSPLLGFILGFMVAFVAFRIVARVWDLIGI